MDSLPLVPTNESNHDVLPVLRETFQELHHNQTISKDLLKNFAKYNSNTVYNEFIKCAGNNIKKNEDELKEFHERISKTEHELMVNHGTNLMQQTDVEENFLLHENTKLKIIPTNINVENNLKSCGLLTVNDLLPSKLLQQIDFRYNQGVFKCKCVPSDKSLKLPKIEGEPSVLLCETSKDISEKQLLCQKIDVFSSRMIELDPKEINFFNFEINKIYRKKIKVMNVWNKKIGIMIDALPKEKCLRIKLNNKETYLAPGMHLYITLIFKPKIYKNFLDRIVLRLSNGRQFNIDINIHRDSAVLRVFIFKSIRDFFLKTTPKNVVFSRSRCTALNFTIDCDSCLVDQFSISSIILENQGKSGNFFIITEDDWFSKSIKNVTDKMELNKGCFWLYPCYFRIEEGETAEINVLFSPNESGFFIEKLYIICDNNSIEELEIVGDAMLFDKHLITVDIPHCSYGINKNPTNCVNLGYLVNESSISFRITIQNNSSIDLPYYWAFHEGGDKPNVNAISYDWLNLVNPMPSIAPYSVQDFVFELNIKSTVKGYHNAYLNFFIKYVPISSLLEDEEYFVNRKESPFGFLDVRIVEIEFVYFALLYEPQPPSPIVRETLTEKRVPKAKIKLSPSILDFGIIPLGCVVEKHFYIENLTRKKIFWKIMEVNYDVDLHPYAVSGKCKNASVDEGELKYKYEKQKITYRIAAKKVQRRASVLVVLVPNITKVVTVEAICLVTYEILSSNIKIRTGKTIYSILCPLEPFYVDVSKTFSIYIENDSLLCGPYHFMTPRGDDADKVEVMLTSWFGIVKPMARKEIKLTITCREVGIFEKIYIPCFTGLGIPIQSLRILCTVDFIHVAFYLPICNVYKKILWPPKLIFDHDHFWDRCVCEWDTDSNKSDIKCWNTLPNVELAPETEKVTPGSTFCHNTNDLLSVVQNEFGDELFIQKHVVQVYDIPLRSLTKISLYVENLTPKDVKLSVETTNFQGLDRSRYSNLSEYFIRNNLFKDKNEMWYDLCDRKYGIVIEPQESEYILSGYSLIEISVLIYACTWGVYMEEILLELDDLPHFCFSLIVEIVGCPLEFPIALNCIEKNPTIRFGHIPYESDPVTRRIKLINITPTTIKLIWRTFAIISEDQKKNDEQFNVSVMCGEDDLPQLIFTDKYYGSEISSYLQIDPKETVIDNYCHTFLDITLIPKYFQITPQSKCVNVMAVGFLYPSEESRVKTNYYLRKGEDTVHPLIIKVEAYIDLPLLNISYLAGHRTLDIYANEILLQKNSDYKISLLLVNTAFIPMDITLRVETPFKILKPTNKSGCIEVGSKLDVTLACCFSNNTIVNMSDNLYLQLSGRFPYNIDMSKKNIFIRKYLQIIHRTNKIIQMVPLNCILRYPNIHIKPDFINFGFVLLGCTQRNSVTVYNLTGYDIPFEVFKSSDVIAVHPSNGTIKKTVGANRQFVDIVISFTPREMLVYEEMIRIRTNIKLYYVDVSIKGTGSSNEKFYV